MQATYKRVKNWFLVKIENILLRRLAANSCVDGKTTIEKTTESSAFSRVLNLVVDSSVSDLLLLSNAAGAVAARSLTCVFVHFISFCFAWHVLYTPWALFARDRDGNSP